MNSLAMKNPMMPQPGKVSTQVITISRTTLQLTLDSRRAALMAELEQDDLRSQEGSAPF